jgi:hypothetical protein
MDNFFGQIDATGTDAIAYLTVYPYNGFENVGEEAVQDLAARIAKAVEAGRRFFIRYASEMNGKYCI